MAYLTRPSRAPGFSRANFPLYLNRDHFVIQCFDIVGWAMEPVKTILTHSLTHSKALLAATYAEAREDSCLFDSGELQQISPRPLTGFGKEEVRRKGG